MSAKSNKERTRAYREKLREKGGRNVSVYLDGPNNERLKALMNYYQLGQNDAVKFAIELTYRATFEPIESVTDNVTINNDLELEQVETSNTESNYYYQEVEPEKPTESEAQYIESNITSNDNKENELVLIVKSMDGEKHTEDSKTKLADWVSTQREKNISLQKICNVLNEAGIPTIRGIPWKPGGLDTFVRSYCKK